MIFEYIQAFFSMEVPAEGTKEYKDFVSVVYVWFLAFLFVAAFYDDVINFFKKKKD